jgi:hypothetical protein
MLVHIISETTWLHIQMIVIFIGNAMRRPPDIHNMFSRVLPVNLILMPSVYYVKVAQYNLNHPDLFKYEI